MIFFVKKRNNFYPKATKVTIYHGLENLCTVSWSKKNTANIAIENILSIMSIYVFIWSMVDTALGILFYETLIEFGV